MKVYFSRRSYIPYLLALLVVALCMFAVFPTKAFAATTYTVNSIGDDPDATPGDSVCETATPDECTLRAAIQEVNAGSGGDTINFNISGTGVHTLTPASAYDTITQSVTINGYSQPGSAVNTAVAPAPLNGTLTIEIDGTNAGGVDGLGINANNVTIQGLVVNRFNQNGIVSSSDSDTVISGNYIGTDTMGTSDLGNQNNGIRVERHATIGGTAAASRNLIAGNNNRGIYGASGTNVIQGNYVGLAADGITRLKNSGRGVEATGGNNTIGGTYTGAMNVISGNGDTGLIIGDGDGDTVRGNYIGLDYTGISLLGNDGPGIFLIGGTNSIIGGTSTAARNFIAGNAIAQVAVYATSGAVVQGNYIGSDKDGNSVSNPNGSYGVAVYNSNDNNLIGGTGAGEGNKIAFNKANGVVIANLPGFGGNAPLNTSIIGNDIEQNALSGIRLCTDDNADFVCDTPEPYSNDAGDPDEGPNMYINFPVINSANKGSGQVTVNYDLDINPAEVGATGYSVDFYANSTNAREGAIYLGSDTVAGSVTGQSATLTLPGSVPADYYVTAVTTMTDASVDGFGHSSEFSAPVLAVVGSAGSTISTTTDSLANTGDNTHLIEVMASMFLVTGLVGSVFLLNNGKMV